MFKKILLIGAALVFAIGVLTASLMRTSGESLAQSYQVEPMAITSVEGTEVETEGTPAAIQEIDYQLAYPGILPDHFLYPLKMIRDRVWLFLTTDSLKKADLLLTYADKRIWAAQMLLDKGKDDLAVSTATKAEKYLEQAAVQGEKAQEAGKNTVAFLEKISQASLKHEEILLGMSNRFSGQAQETIEKILEYPRRTLNQLRSFKEEIKATLKLEFESEETRTFSEVGLEQPATAFGILAKVAQEEGIKLLTKEYDFGILVESIGGIENTQERAWIYFVNDQAGEVAADQKEISSGDVVEWRYIEPIY